jgi:light-regulated signal transduction histidine kinase (bacteriophytochrome)
VQQADLAADLPPALVRPDDRESRLSDLVGNAVKYGRDGGTVTVRGAVDDGRLRLDVADTGIGIKPENLAPPGRVLPREARRDPRARGHRPRPLDRQAPRGARRGRLEESGVEGEGSTFSVLLPA